MRAAGANDTQPVTTRVESCQAGQEKGLAQASPFSTESTLRVGEILLRNVKLPFGQ